MCDGASVTVYVSGERRASEKRKLCFFAALWRENAKRPEGLQNTCKLSGRKVREKRLNGIGVKLLVVERGI